MFVVSTNLESSFVAKGLVQTNIWAPISHDAWMEFLPNLIYNQ